MTVEILGLLAGALTTLSFLPQAVKIHRTQKTQDLSLGTFIAFSLGLVFWLIYGWLLRSIPIVLANSITLLIAGYILFMKIKYK